MDESLAREFQKFIEAVVEKRCSGGAAVQVPTQAIRQDASVIAVVNGRLRVAVMATEEPVRAGELVWMTKANGERWLVHGGAS
jgi:co-chaperonin GroES (HSP10)